MFVQKTDPRQEMKLMPIGKVVWDEGGNRLEIDEKFRPAMLHLSRFSHLVVLWWCADHDDEESRSLFQQPLPYANNELAGAFACRTPLRPNPIGMTTVTVHGVDEEKGIVKIGDIDAFDGTQILDLKPYLPVFDKVRDLNIPDYYMQWPGWEWMPENGVPPFEMFEE